MSSSSSSSIHAKPEIESKSQSAAQSDSDITSTMSMSALLLRWVNKGKAPSELLKSNFLPLMMPKPVAEKSIQSKAIEWHRVGRVSHDTVKLLRRFHDAFDLTQPDAVCIHPEHANTKSFSQITHSLHSQGIIGAWRNELYPVTRQFADATPLAIERATSNLFGIRTFGSHMNAYVCANAASGDLRPTHYWVSRRSMTKSSYPGKLDQLAAGGIEHGTSIVDTMRKECKEEAGIADPALLSHLRPVGYIEYVRVTNKSAETEVARPIDCVKHGVQFTFDLPLPIDFQPHNTDGEVQSFEKLTVAELIRRVCHTDDFKFNCNLVIIDWLIRHGFVSPDDADYCQLVRGMRIAD